MSDLQVAYIGVTQALLAWSNANGTASYRMQIVELTTNSSGGISDLKPGTHKSLAVQGSNETQHDLWVTEGVSGELRNCVSGFDFYHLLVYVCVGFENCW